MPKTIPGAPAGLNETQPLRPMGDARESAQGDGRFQEVQQRAYQLWEEAGKPEGDGARERFWHEAERAVAQTSSQTGQ